MPSVSGAEVLMFKAKVLYGNWNILCRKGRATRISLRLNLQLTKEIPEIKEVKGKQYKALSEQQVDVDSNDSQTFKKNMLDFCPGLFGPVASSGTDTGKSN